MNAVTPKIQIISTVDQLRTFFETPRNKEYVVIDTETDGILEKSAKLYGIGICFDAEDSYYIPIRDKQGTLLWKEKTLNKLAKEIQKLTETYKFIGHNVIYDTLILKNNLNIELAYNIYADTILLKHCIDEEPPFGLKETSVKYLGPWADKAQQQLHENIKKNGGRTTKENMEMFKADTEVLAEYCAWDVVLTYLLFEKFSPLLKEQGLEKLYYEDEIMPLYKECVIPMKDKGFPIDLDHFNKLQIDITNDIIKLEDEIQEDISQYTSSFIQQQLDKEFPVKTSGNFPKELALLLGLPGDFKITKAAMSKLKPKNEAESLFQDFILISPDFVGSSLIEQTQRTLWYKRNPEDKYIFNLNSTKHLSWLFFDELGIVSEQQTESGAPKLNAEVLEELAGQHPFCDKIIEFKKLQKLKGTYIEGILDREYQGIVYASFLMFGTTSGRFSSRDPNLQNMPRIKDEESNLSPLVLKYTNAIKEGFIAGPGYKIVNADYSALEPTAFAAACGDKKLQKIFLDKHDLYSSIAIEATGLYEYSADKKAPNYLGKQRKELRQKYKAVALAVVYGAEEHRISQVLDCSREEALEIINSYLDAYPGLVQYMNDCDRQVATKGFVKNRFGRIRHLPEAKRLADTYGKQLLDRHWAKKNDLSLSRWTLKNQLNNGKNFPIQSTAAHIVNRAMIAVTRKFKECGIDGYVAAQVHDELTCIVREDQAELAAKLLQEAMISTTKIEVPLSTEPVIGYNWAESK